MLADIGLEYHPNGTYHLSMDDNSLIKQPPPGWLEALARSEAQVAAGQIFSGEAIMRELDESIALRGPDGRVTESLG
jgi:hypothetical protein